MQSRCALIFLIQINEGLNFTKIKLKMSKQKYNQTKLSEQLRVFNLMSNVENKNEKTGNPNFYKLGKPV